MKQAEKLVQEALDALDLARAKLQDAVSTVLANDYGDSGAAFIDCVEGEVATKLVAAYSIVEDLYAYAEDLVEAP